MEFYYEGLNMKLKNNTEIGDCAFDSCTNPERIDVIENYE